MREIFRISFKLAHCWTLAHESLIYLVVVSHAVAVEHSNFKGLTVTCNNSIPSYSISTFTLARAVVINHPWSACSAAITAWYKYCHDQDQCYEHSASYAPCNAQTMNLCSYIVSFIYTSYCVCNPLHMLQINTFIFIFNTVLMFLTYYIHRLEILLAPVTVVLCRLTVIIDAYISFTASTCASIYIRRLCGMHDNPSF